MGSEIGERLERVLADERAALIGDLSRSISEHVQVDVAAARDLGTAICAAVDAAMGRIAIPITVRQDAQPAPTVDTAPIIAGLSPLAREIADATRAMAAISLPAPRVDVAFDSGPMARAIAGREDSAAAAVASLALALAGHADAISAQAKATAELAVAMSRPRRIRIDIERDQAGRTKRYQIEEA